MGAENNTQTDKPRFVGKVSYVPLTEVCNPKQWKTIQKSDLLTEGYPVYGANGVIGYFDEYNHEEETVLITCRGATCGTVRMCASKSYVTGNAMCLDSLDENIDANFLMHYLRGYDFGSIISGSAQPQITRASLRRVMVPVLSKEDQLEFCRGIQSIEKTSNRLCSLLLTLDSLVKSRFVELINLGNASHRSVRDCCIYVSRGKSPNYADESDVLVVNQACIRQQGLDLSKAKRQIREKIGRTRVLQPGDVLLNSTGTGTLGRTCVVPDVANTLIADSHVTIMTPDETIMLPAWLNCLMSLPNTQANLYRECVSGSTNQIELSKTKLLEFSIPVVNLALQQEFAALAQRVDKLRFAIQEQIKKLETLKASLMQEYFG